MKKRAARPVDPEATTPGLVLDAGALLALEKRNIRLLTDLARAAELGLPIRIPAGCLAQVWRGGPRSATIARLLKHASSIVRLDERSAREIGEFLAYLRLEGDKPDIVDAQVALVARSTRSLVWTSDAGDMARYQVDPSFVRKV